MLTHCSFLILELREKNDKELFYINKYLTDNVFKPGPVFRSVILFCLSCKSASFVWKCKCNLLEIDDPTL